MVELQEQVDQGGLAGAAASDDRHALAGQNLEREVLEDGRQIPFVAERDLVEAQMAFDGGEIQQ